MPAKGLFYDAFLFPMELAWFRKWRRDLLSNLHGEVLEIGAGTGVNLKHYPPAIDRLTVIDPNSSNILRFCRRAEDLGWGEEEGKRRLCPFIGCGEEMPFSDSSFDFVIMTLLLCSVEDPKKVVSEASRVLKEGGKLLLMEHQLPLRQLQAWAFKTAAPMWAMLSGCRLDRRTELVLQKAPVLKIVKISRKGPFLGRPFLITEMVKVP